MMINISGRPLRIHWYCLLKVQMRRLVDGFPATVCLIVYLAACSSPPATVNASPPLFEFIERSVREKAVAYPDIRIEGVRLSPDTAVACGYLIVPGKEPHVFAALDDDLTDIQRPIAMPFLGNPGSWDMDHNRQLSDSWARRCERFGISLPPAESIE